MKIYFCGSISGGRDMLHAYRMMVGELKHHGEVLTEHVADPELTSGGEATTDNRHIFDRDMAWLHDADIIIAEVTTPSLGVGYEIAAGVRRGIPVHAFFQDTGKRLSALVSGNPGVTVHRYTDPGSLQEIIRNIMSQRNESGLNP